MADVPSWVAVGEKVLVRDKGLVGTVKFVGNTEFAPGVWVGIALSQPDGKNSGSVKGKSYFTCPENHGLFLRPNNVEQHVPPAQVGDSDDSAIPDWLHVGARVLVKDKGLEGTARFVGSTHFAPGIWVGVELPTAQGKNSGTVKGKSYFSCPENHGLFVRPPQVEPVGEVLLEPSTPRGAGSSIPLPRSARAHTGRKTPVGGRSPSAKRSAASKLGTSSKDISEGEDVVPSAAVEQTKVQSFAPPSANTGVSAEVKDLQQKLAILQQKRSEDKARLKELEKYRVQYAQMVEYRNKWTESHNEVQQQLKAAKKEAREAMLQKEAAEEELRELSDAVEIATLDKEMAEEKCEGMTSEINELNEKIQELTIDLEIIQNEIHESGYEGAAAGAQLKQLEQQNARLKDALVRLRDLSNQEKQEHQQLVKDLEKQNVSLSALKEHKERLEEELKESERFIDELKEQVDVALGAEEMVETLTEKNLALEDELSQLTETVNDLEALRELSEQQEELRVEVEHELREEVDLNQNSIRQLQRRLDASQETIVDQQQTIVKFREVVHQLQSDISELRQRPSEDEGTGQSSDLIATTRPESMLVQLKSTATKAYSRTVEFELRKMEAKQAAEMVNVLKAFMPSSFLVSGGDYDALNVMMLLPRLVFKCELIIDQLKQQVNLEEALGSLSTLKPDSRTDLLTYSCFLIYKLSTLELNVNKVLRILGECDLMLYRQMGSLRDDLAIHERSLDILIELLKKEQLDGSVPLTGVEKAINHLELLQQTRLAHTTRFGHNENLLDQMKVMIAGSDYCTLELLRLTNHAPNVCSFKTQMKELESFTNDIRQACRKIRRRVPSKGSNKIVVCPLELVASPIYRQSLLVTCFRALYVKVSQKANSLSDGEALSNGELETFLQEVAGVVLQELVAVEQSKPEDLPHVCLSKMGKSLENFLNDIQDGVYDTVAPKEKPTLPMMVRAQTVKGELSDTEGLKFKLEERHGEILEIKKALKLKAQEVGECNMKIGLLEKKLENIDIECAKKVEEEKQETERIRGIMEQQERKFNKAMEVLQGDIEAVENERDTLKHQIETQSHAAIPPDISGTRRSGSLSGRKALASFLSHSSSLRRTHDQPSAAPAMIPSTGSISEAEPSPLLLAKIDALKKALSCSQDENIHMKAQIVKAKFAALPPLHVPKRLKPLQPINSTDEENQKMKEGNKVAEDESDVVKSLNKRSDSLLQESISLMSKLRVVDITNKTKPLTPRQQFDLQVTYVHELQKKKAKFVEDCQKAFAGSYPGGVVRSRLKHFISPQFSKVMEQSSGGPPLLATLRLPPSVQKQGSLDSGGSLTKKRKLYLAPAQFEALHSAVVN